MKTKHILNHATFCLFSVFASAAYADADAPNRAQAIGFFNEGVAAVNHNDFPSAETKFKAAVAADPRMPEPYCNLGMTLASQGRYDEAVEELTKARDLNPKIALVYSNLGSAYQGVGKNKEAVDSYKKFLELAPKDPQATNIRNIIAMLQNDLAHQSKNQMPNGENDYLGDATRNGMARWPASRMPITIYIQKGKGVPGYRDDFERILRQSFDEWQTGTNDLIKMKFVDSPDQAEIICSWTDNPKEMISQAEGGHAMVVPDQDGIAKTHLYLLTIRQSDQGPLSENHAHRIDLHEIGHSLGLLGHSSNPGDVMFGTIMPNDVPCSLTDKDKNTLIALYSADDAIMKAHPLHAADMIAGDPNSAVVRSVKLNHEAAEAMQAKNFVLAIEKLQEAHKIAPTNDTITGNLGLAYGNAGAMCMMLSQFKMADQYFSKALEFADKSASKASYISILKNYSTLLRATNRASEADKIDAKVKSLGGS